MRMSRKYLLFILIVFVGATFFLVHSLNTLAGRSRQQVRQELQRLIGNDATFDGLEVRFLSGFGFSAREFRIADDSRFAATPLVRAKELRLGVNLAQLLLGRVVIDSLSFHEPEFQVITDESGLLNLSELASGKRKFGALPGLRTASPERKPATVHFLVTRIRLKNGRIDFVDRSIKEAAELQVKNIEMEINGLDPAGHTRLKFAAAVTEGLGHDVRIEGQLGPIQPGKNWSQQPVDLQVQFDSLQVPLLTRAIPFLRNKIPREVDVTGPFSLRAKLAGSLERPRITDVALKGILFGSSDYNAILTGDLEIPQNRSWADAEIKGKLFLDRVHLTPLRNLPFLRQILPVALVMEGPMAFSSRFEGSWRNLRVGALLKAENTEIRYRDWLRKPAGNSAELRAIISRRENGFMLHESVLRLGDAKMTLSGVAEETAAPRLRIRLRSDSSQLAAWSDLVLPLALFRTGGRVDYDMILENHSASPDGDWKIQGKLNLTDAEFKHKESVRKIDQLNANVLFLGKAARVEKASFRLGSSRMTMTANVQELAEPRATYQLRSAELNPVDLPLFPPPPSNRFRNVTSSGNIRLQEGNPLLQGTLTSSEGNFHDVAYRDLRAEVSWSPMGITFKNLSLQSLNGKVHAAGFWVANGDRAQSFELASQIDSMDARSLLMRIFPQLKHRIEGQLDFRGQFNATSQNGAIVKAALKGSGETLIHRGTIKDFNLISNLFLKGSGPSAPAKIASRLPANLAAIANRQDTQFDSLRASFTVEEQRIHTDHLSLSTPEYTITGAGWSRFDGTTSWNGILVVSPAVTQELQREYKTIRHLLDRRGRFAIAFRLDGKFPNVKMRLENRALAQFLGWRAPAAGNEVFGSREKDQEKTERKNWLPESLEQWLNR